MKRTIIHFCDCAHRRPYHAKSGDVLNTCNACGRKYPSYLDGKIKHLWAWCSAVVLKGTQKPAKFCMQCGILKVDVDDKIESKLCRLRR